MDTLPNLKMFDATFVDPVDVALLARRAARNQTNGTSGITLNFSGLSDLIGARPASADHSSNVSAAHPKLPPKISLEEFCNQYQLTDSIYNRLTNLQVTGPHALRFLENQVLRDEGFLSTAQVADVRDAQERWEGGNDS